MSDPIFNSICGRGKQKNTLRVMLSAVAVCALLVSCSSTDTLSDLGLSPENLQSAAADSADVDASADIESAAGSGVKEATQGESKPAVSRTTLASLFQHKGSAGAGESSPAARQAQAEPKQTARQESDSGESSGKTAEKQSFLSTFFSPNKSRSMTAEKTGTRSQSAAGEDNAKEKPKPELTALALTDPGNTVSSGIGGAALPGVRSKEQLFEIIRGPGSSDNSDIDLYEYENLYQTASAAGLARLAPHGLLKKRDSVDVSCFKPRLVRTLKTIERHFGKRVLVTSGYRSPAHNKRVRGARNSLHMDCAAADIQIQGVSKWELARYARSLPGRGGVGTYCHTRSIHVDVGPRRDWNWSC